MAIKKLTETRDSADQVVVPGDHVIFVMPGEKKRLGPGVVKNITPLGQVRVTYPGRVYKRGTGYVDGMVEVVSKVFIKDPRFEFKESAEEKEFTTPLPKFEGYSPEIVRELQAAFTMAVYNAGGRVTVDDVPFIDLTVSMMESLKAAGNEGNWMPEEYTMNDIVSDLCEYMRHGPSAFMPRAS